MRYVLIIALILALSASVVRADAQHFGCHGRGKPGVLALNVRWWPWGPLTGHQLYEHQRIDIHGQQNDDAGLPWYRVAFANTPDDPAIFWVAGWLVDLEACSAVPHG